MDLLSNFKNILGIGDPFDDCKKMCLERLKRLSLLSENDTNIFTNITKIRAEIESGEGPLDKESCPLVKKFRELKKDYFENLESSLEELLLMSNDIKRYQATFEQRGFDPAKINGIREVGEICNLLYEEQRDKYEALRDKD